MDSKLVWQTVAIIGASVLAALVVTKVGRAVAAHDDALNGDALIPADVDTDEDGAGD